jgi:hypothetical protein
LRTFLPGLMGREITLSYQITAPSATMRLSSPPPFGSLFVFKTGQPATQ